MLLSSPQPAHCALPTFSIYYSTCSSYGASSSGRPCRRKPFFFSFLFFFVAHVVQSGCRGTACSLRNLARKKHQRAASASTVGRCTITPSCSSPKPESCLVSNTLWPPRLGRAGARGDIGGMDLIFDHSAFSPGLPIPKKLLLRDSVRRSTLYDSAVLSVL